MARSEEFSEQSADVVIVGGGPIGYIQAWGLKKINPDLNIVVLEKYNEFRRKHTLVMQPKQLKKLIQAADAQDDPAINELLNQLNRSKNIRTNRLQEFFKQLSEALGVQTIIEEVKQESIEQQIFRFQPKFIVGADGTHSIVNRKLFPAGNKQHHEIDYAMQIRFEIDGDASRGFDHSVSFFQRLARQGFIATEQAGRRDATTGKTPVTVQLIISKDDFMALKDIATAKNPLLPFSNATDANRLPKHISDFIYSYLLEAIKINSDDSIRQSSIRLSVNQLPATQALAIHSRYNDTPVTLNGDSALGLSYFKGLNAGIESSAKFFNLMKPAIQQGLTAPELINTGLIDYQAWFDNYAPKKVAEVRRFSALRVRSGSAYIRTLRWLQQFSKREVEADQKTIIDTHFLLNSKYSNGEPITFDPYPHRSYDPTIHLSQYSYIPISYSLKKTGKIFADFFRPYKGSYQLKQDFKQPLVGCYNFTSGVTKIVAGFFTLKGKRFVDGWFSLFRGGVEIITTPLVWTIKPVTRGLITLFSKHKKIENNSGIRRLKNQGESILNANPDRKLSTLEIRQLLGISNDIHRKFSKSIQRQQRTDVPVRHEQQRITALTSRFSGNDLSRDTFKYYFGLFDPHKSSQQQHEPREISKLNLHSHRVAI